VRFCRASLVATWREKFVQYIECTEGDIQAAIVLDAQYPKANTATVALRVVDSTGATTGSWVPYFEPIYDDDSVVEQPDGQIGLYISDLAPLVCHRLSVAPSATETTAGTTRLSTPPKLLVTTS
jgi:hypothetical protein